MKFCPYFSQRLVNLLNLVHGKSEHWKQCVIPFSKQHKWNVLHFSQREPFCSAPLQGLFLLCIWDNHHKRHHKQEYVRYTISFSQPFRHPKIGEIKLVGFAFLFHFYYIASFLKEWTGCQAYF